MTSTANLISTACTVIALTAAPAAAVTEWTLAPSGTGCAIESSPESVEDGYQTTTARIRVDRKALLVSSPSAFDGGLNDIGISVDGQPMIPMDRLNNARTAVFESRYATLVEQMKRGARGRVQLRFWPTWPATGTHAVTFSLIGFTRAYARLEQCQ